MLQILNPYNYQSYKRHKIIWRNNDTRRRTIKWLWRQRYLGSNTNTDVNYSESNSVASAIAAVALRHLQWEDLNCQKKKCLRVSRNLYYKHLYCPIRTTVLHVVNTAIVIEVTAREEKAKTVENTFMVISMNLLRVQRSRSCAIYNSLCLSKVLPTALSIPAVSIDEYSTSSVEAVPRAACIEKATVPQHTSKIFWWHQYF